MKARLLIGSVATVALAVLACSDKTPVYAGQPTPGAAVTMTLNRTAFAMPDGGKATLAAQLFDSAGNVVTGTIAFASCNSAVVTTTDSATAPSNWAAATTLTAASVSAAAAGTLVPTPTCVTASTSGGAIVDTALVTVGPASVSIAGPATAASGRQLALVDTLVYTVTGYNKAGTALAANSFFHQWGTADSSMFKPLSRTADSVRIVSPGHIGVARVLVTAVGGATAVLNVNVIPDAFVGTITTPNPLTSPAIDSLNLTRTGTTVYDTSGSALGASNGINTRYFVDGVETFSRTAVTTAATTLFLVMPPITHTGVVPVVIGNMGGTACPASGLNPPGTGQSASGIFPCKIGDAWQTINVTAGANAMLTSDINDPANDLAAGAPLTSQAVVAVPAVAALRFGTLTGASCVDNTVAGAGGTDCLDWWAFRNTDAVNAHPLNISLLWLTDADVDMTVFDDAGTTALSPNGSTRAVGAFNAVGEAVALTVPSNTTIRIRVRFHAAGSASITLYRLTYLMN